MYDLIIIGGGPAGVAAGVYAARKKIKTILITDSFGGQSIVSDDIQNWIGARSISGFDLAKALEEHLRAQDGIEIVGDDRVESVQKTGDGFALKTKRGRELETKFIFVATGSRRRKLGIPGEEEFTGKGVAYCATCDAPLFQNKVVAVIGGGNAGLESAIDLLPYASKIYILEYGEALKGDAITQEKIKANSKIEILTMAQSLAVLGEKFVTGLKYKDRRANEEKELKLDGVFVEIGSVPNSDLIKGLAEINKLGEIVVDHKTQQSSDPHIYAAGDVSDVLYKQNNISAGDATKAVLSIADRLSKNQ